MTVKHTIKECKTYSESVDAKELFIAVQTYSVGDVFVGPR